MESRKSHHIIEIQSIKPSENSQTISFILERCNGFATELAVEKEGYQVLKKDINEKISSWIMGLYHAEKSKISKWLDEIEEIFLFLHEDFEQFAKKKQTSFRLDDNIILYLNNLYQRLVLMIETLKNIEELIKKNYQDPVLATKIENYKLIFEFKQKNINRFFDAVKLYIDNKKLIEQKYALLKKTKIKNETLDELIKNNEKEIQEKQLMLEEFRHHFNTFDQSIKVLKDCLETGDYKNKNSESVKLTNDIYLFEQSVELTKQFFNNNIVENIEKSKNFLVDIQKGHEASKIKINLSYQEFQNYFDCLDDIEKNNEKMKSLIEIIRSMSIDVKSNASIDLAKNNLVSINNCSSLMENLLEKIGEFSEELGNLEKEFKSLKEASKDDQFFHTKKRRAVIDSAEYIDSHILSQSEKKEKNEKNEKNENKDKNAEKKEQSISSISLFYSQELMEYIKRQIKTHVWEVHGVGNQGTLYDAITDDPFSEKKTMKITKMATTHHIGKMFHLFNAQTLTPEAKGETLVVSQVKNIFNHALNTVSLFRANSTQVAYHNLYEDINNIQKLIYYDQPEVIERLIDAIVDEHPISHGLIEFETKYQRIKEKCKSSLDQLIQLYFVTKDYLYHKKISYEEREYLYCIILLLKQTDVIDSIENIKNEIIKRSKNQEWNVFIGGEIINIDEVNYKVPYHIERMWHTLNKNNENELNSFSNRCDFTSYKILSKLMCSAYYAIFNMPCYRDKTSQAFYIDFLVGKFFLSHGADNLLKCQK